MRFLNILILGAVLAGAAAPARGEELHCRTYWRNSLSGMKAYTDCGEDPYYGSSESDGISWFYGFRRVDKYIDDRKADQRYNRDLFLKTGMTQDEVDGLMRAKDSGGKAPEEMAPDKINLDLAALAASELFVYSSTAAQKNLADQYYTTLMAQPQIAAKTTDKDKDALRARLAKLSPDLARLRAILDSFVPAETPRLGMDLAAYKAAKTGAEETSPNVYTSTREQVGVSLTITRRFMDEKLISSMLSFAPLADPWAELEQLRLLLNRSYGWPLSCASGERNEISCRWEDKAGNAVVTGGVTSDEGGRELTVTLISTKALTEVAENPAQSAGGQ